MVGYFNRNSKQELDIPVGPNNRIEPGGPDMGQPTHFLSGRYWGVFTIKLPKDFGDKKLTWTLVANGYTNAITLHTKSDYILEPFEDPANKNTPPVLRFDAKGPSFTGPPEGIAATMTATVGEPFKLAAWATDEGAKINVPPATGRRPGPGGAAPAEAPARSTNAESEMERLPRPGRPSSSIHTIPRSMSPRPAKRRPRQRSPRPASTSCGCRRMIRRVKAAAAFSAAGRTRTFASRSKDLPRSRRRFAPGAARLRRRRTGRASLRSRGSGGLAPLGRSGRTLIAPRS